MRLHIVALFLAGSAVAKPTPYQMYHSWKVMHPGPPSDSYAQLSASQKACIKTHAKSQWNEDIRLIAGLHAIAGGKPGTFVEIGALDGVYLSNTYVLEKCLAWTGLLIEGNPKNFANLQANVANGHRNATRVRTEHSAVCSTPVGGTLRMTVDGGPVSTVPQTAAEKFLHDWKSVNHPDHLVDVPCRPMSSMLADANLTSPTFLSLDVEGAEEIVVRTFNPSAFKVILVEADGTEPEKDDNVRSLFAESGLRMQAKRYGPSPEQLEYMKIPPLSASSQLHVMPEHEAALKGVTALCPENGWCNVQYIR
jgi:FkbM family methyltransferase